jgi:hypothetical protein
MFQLNTCGYSPYVTSSLTRGWVCRLQFLLVLDRAVILRSSRGTHGSLLSQIRDSPNLEGQVPVFMSPTNRVTWLCPQALGSLFVASYDSQGYGKSIRPRLHIGVTLLASIVLLITPLHEQSKKHSLQQNLYCCMRIRCRGNVFTEPLPSNGSTRYNIFMNVSIWKQCTVDN